MKRRLARIAIPGVLGAAAVIGFVVYRMIAPVTVEVARPVEVTQIEVFGLGTVEARVVTAVGFETGGTITGLHADHGDAVKAGGMLARLADEEQAARLDRAAAAVESATAAVKSAESAVAKARAIVDQRRQTYSRAEKLFARQTVSAETVDEARMQKLSAEAELGVALSNVEVARAALSEARAQQRFERILLDQHELRAPLDGLVFERRKELGAVVAPGEPVFALVDPRTVWVLAYVDEARAGEVQVGQPARIRLRSLPRQEFNGRVARIGIESDRVSEERRIYVGCDDCPPDFHLGEQAEVLITTATLADALLVPEAAVADYDGRRGYVWTVEDGELRRRAVSLGHRTLDAQLQVVDGLPADARIVIELVNRLREGRGAIIETGAAG